MTEIVPDKVLRLEDFNKGYNKGRRVAKLEMQSKLLHLAKEKKLSDDIVNEILKICE